MSLQAHCQHAKDISPFQVTGSLPGLLLWAVVIHLHGRHKGCAAAADRSGTCRVGGRSAAGIRDRRGLAPHIAASRCGAGAGSLSESM